MKKHLSLIVVIMVSGLLFSCKNSVELVKRHYGSGYYLSVKKGTKHKAEGQERNGKIANVEIKKALTSVVKENSITEQVKETPVITASSTKAPYVLVHKHVNTPASADLQTTKKLILWNSAATGTKKHKNPTTYVKATSDSEQIVLVILCIFIPPLAVFLKENSIGVHFWIDLLLCILFWLPGVIFAFLVCFDVIN